MDPFLKSEVFPQLGKAAKWLYDQFKGLVAFLGPKVMPLLKDLWKIIQDVWNTSLKPMLQELASWLKKNWPLIKKFIENWLKGALQGIATKLQRAADYFKIKIADGAGNAFATISAIWRAKSLNLWEKLGLLWQSKSTNILEKLGVSIGLIIRSLIQVPLNMMRGIISGVVGLVRGIFRGVFRGLGDTIKGIWNRAAGIVKSAFRGIVSFIKGVFRNVGGFLSGTLRAIGNAFRVLYNYVLRPIINFGITLLNAMIDMYNAISGVIRVLTLGLVNLGHIRHIGYAARLPQLALGGKVVSEGLAHIHPNEFVVPAAKVEPLSTSINAGGKIAIKNYLIVDGRVLAESVNRVSRQDDKLMTGSSIGGRYWRVA